MEEYIEANFTVLLAITTPSASPIRTLRLRIPSSVESKMRNCGNLDIVRWQKGLAGLEGLRNFFCFV